MELFNRYFTGLQPGLKPTKGYATDGRRFLEDTHRTRETHNIEPAMLIRKR